MSMLYMKYFEDYKNELNKDKPDLKKVRGLVQVCAELDLAWVDEISHMGLIHHAARAGADDLVVMCLRAGVDPNMQTKMGRSALHIACADNVGSVVTILLSDPRTKINLKTLGGATPLHLACRFNAREAVLRLTSQVQHELMPELENNERRKAIDLTTNEEIKLMIEEYESTRREVLSRIIEKEQKDAALAKEKAENEANLIKEAEKFAQI